ncbi:hypothetical protein [Chromatium okenii]|uniref:hypothetical protein n=1 Tax=Chromatium okenii TaxID=61644 RepID=UPI001907C9A7|nr:hypothetical protein [Chromatium okenii]
MIAHIQHHCLGLLLVTFGLLVVSLTALADVKLSGFGTLGGAISDQDFIYQRFIDNSGTLYRDSVIGVQLDVTHQNGWGLTLQAKAGASTHNDTDWEAVLNWAFLSWRPANDWLLRAGRLRLPLMLHSANSDVGVTFPFARLPTELYSLLPTVDMNGLSVAKTWLTETTEWTLEGYLGKTHADWRYYLRDGLEPLFPSGAMFLAYDFEMIGAVLSRISERHTWRVGIHHTTAAWDVGPTPIRFPFVPLMPGSTLGYYKVSPELPGPPIRYAENYDIYLFTLGTEIRLPQQWQLTIEYGRRHFTEAVVGADTHAGYLSLSKHIGRWTPYCYWAGIRSDNQGLNLAKAMNRNQLPATVPGAALINMTQRAGADLIDPYEQKSLALGTAYHLSRTSSFKLEWLHTRTGALSSFVNAPFGEDSGGRQINVFSLSYSHTF